MALRGMYWISWAQVNNSSIKARILQRVSANTNCERESRKRIIVVFNRYEENIDDRVIKSATLVR